MTPDSYSTGRWENRDTGPAEGNVIKYLIPHIELSYRVKPGPSYRLLVGFSDEDLEHEFVTFVDDDEKHGWSAMTFLQQGLGRARWTVGSDCLRRARVGQHTRRVDRTGRRGVRTMTSSSVLLEGLSFGEAPRWRGGRLWFSDFHRRAVYAVGSDGVESKIVDVPGQPSGLGWLPDGRLLVVSMTDRRVLRL